MFNERISKGSLWCILTNREPEARVTQIIVDTLPCHARLHCDIKVFCMKCHHLIHFCQVEAYPSLHDSRSNSNTLRSLSAFRLHTCNDNYFTLCTKAYKLLTWVAVTPPSMPVPVPNGIIGTLASLHSLAHWLTSAVDRGKTTAAGIRHLFTHMYGACCECILDKHLKNGINYVNVIRTGSPIRPVRVGTWQLLSLKSFRHQQRTSETLVAYPRLLLHLSMETTTH